MNPLRVLVVDDEPDVRGFCREVLEDSGLEVHEAESAAAALEHLDSEGAEVVLSDMNMPGMSGVELLRTVRQTHPNTDFLIMTGCGTVSSAVEAMKLGAYDYIAKPIDLQAMLALFRRLRERRDLIAERNLFRRQLADREVLKGLVGRSAPMRETYQTVLRVAERRTPVLILGESGTGKELVARAIHTHGPWSAQPFVAVDCGALPAHLMESELFGHVKGAFTDARTAREGLMASAREGTVFLDEIGELPLALQAKLLRVLQERTFRPVGSNLNQPLKARVLAATNRDLKAAVDRGEFRADLFYRLNVVSLVLPPLAARRGDIPELAHFFLEKHGAEGPPLNGFTAEAMARLIAYDWPGNVRELENVVYRAATLALGPWIDLRDLGAEIRESHVPTAQGSLTPLERMERDAILDSLKVTGGHKVKAAQHLGMSKTSLYRKIKEYGIETP